MAAYGLAGILAGMLGFFIPIHYNAILVLAAQAVPGEYASVFVFGLVFTFLCASVLSGPPGNFEKASSRPSSSCPNAPGNPPAEYAIRARKANTGHGSRKPPTGNAFIASSSPGAIKTIKKKVSWRTSTTLLAGYAFATAFLPLLFTIVPLAYAALRPTLGYALAALCLLLVWASPRKANSLLVLIASGGLGFAVLFFGFCSQPFLALFTGFFGLSDRNKKEGIIPGTALRFPDMAAATFLSLFLVMLPAATPFLLSGAAGVFYPGALAGQQPVILVAKTLFDIASAFAIGKARSQASAYLVESQASLADLYPGLVAGAAGIIVAVFVFDRLRGKLSKISGKTATLAARVCLVALVILLSGWRGLLVAAAALFVSKIAESYDLSEGLCLGSLYAPAIAYSFGATPALARVFLGF